MLKRITIGLLAAAMAVSVLAGCGGSSSSAPTPAPEGSSSTEAPAPDAPDAPAAAYKIGIITGTVSQGEEEFRAAEALKEKYPDIVETATYPDKFAQEQQQVIQTIKNMAQIEGMKAIIMCQAVPGAKAAFDDIRNDPATEEILLIAAVPQEDPGIIGPSADIIFQVDEANMGQAIAKQAKDLGATKLVHYSFARHMAMAPLAMRRDVMKKAAEELGMEFIAAECPDPLGEQGLPGAQQFMNEDVPKKIKELAPEGGTDKVAFFNTNCGMQEPLIKQIMTGGETALYPQQCCPSPLHAYPGALGVSIPEDKKGDIEFIVGEIKKSIAEKGGAGRFSTWPVPVNMSFVNAGFEYATKYAMGEIKDGFEDPAVVEATLKSVIGDKVQIGRFDDGQKVWDNYYVVLSDYIVF